MSKLLSLQLEFSYESPFFAEGLILLDDVGFDYCAEEDVPVDSDQLSCDFNQMTTCSWYHDFSASTVWKHEVATSDGEFTQFQFDLIILLIT